MFTVDGYRSPMSVWREFYSLQKQQNCAEEVSDPAMSRQLANEAFTFFLFQSTSAKVYLPGGRLVEVDDGFLATVTSTSPFTHAYFELNTGLIGETKVSLFWFRMIARILKFKKWLGIALIAAALAILTTCLLVACAAFQSIFYNSNFFSSIGLLASNRAAWAFLFAGAVAVISLLYVIYFIIIRTKAVQACQGFDGGRLIFSREQVTAFVDSFYQGCATLEPAGPSPAIELDVTSEDYRCAIQIVAAHDVVSAKGAKLIKEDARTAFGSQVSSGRAFDRGWEHARRLRPELGGGGRPKKQVQ